MLDQGVDAILLFAGEGECEDNVKTLAREKRLADKTLFLGMRTDIPDLMQAMDVFALASFWEGLPVVGVEAQASGLHCVVSDGVTKEMNALGLVDYISLDAPVSEWAAHIIKAGRSERRNTFLRLQEAGYDIHTTVPWLQSFYLSKG